MCVCVDALHTGSGLYYSYISWDTSVQDPGTGDGSASCLCLISVDILSLRILMQFIISVYDGWLDQTHQLLSNDSLISTNNGFQNRQNGFAQVNEIIAFSAIYYCRLLVNILFVEEDVQLFSFLKQRILLWCAIFFFLFIYIHIKSTPESVYSK